MDNTYIVLHGTNPANQLRFGANAQFFSTSRIDLYKNQVINLDQLPAGPILIGYIVGGIMSTKANTNTLADSTAFPLHLHCQADQTIIFINPISFH